MTLSSCDRVMHNQYSENRDLTDLLAMYNFCFDQHYFRGKLWPGHHGQLMVHYTLVRMTNILSKLILSHNDSISPNLRPTKDSFWEHPSFLFRSLFYLFGNFLKAFWLNKVQAYYGTLKKKTLLVKHNFQNKCDIWVSGCPSTRCASSE